MFRNTWCASEKTELSNAPAAWTFDSMHPALKSVRVGSAGTLECVPASPSNEACPGLAEHVRGPIFVCDYPRVVAIGKDRNSQRGSALQGISFSIRILTLDDDAAW